MRPRRPIGITRPLAPILGRTRPPWRRGGLAPMIWRRGRARVRPPFAPRGARPLSPSIHYAINLALTWPPHGAPAAMGERRVERILREVLRVAGPVPRGPGAAERRLSLLIERLRQSRHGAAPTRSSDALGGTSLWPFLAGAIAAPLRRAAPSEPAREGPAGRRRSGPPETRVFADRPSTLAPAETRRPIHLGRTGRMAGETAPRLPRFRETVGAATHAPARIARRTRAIEIWRDGGAAAGLSAPAYQPGRPARIDVEAASPRKPSLLVWRDPLFPKAAWARAAAVPPSSGSRRARADLVWRDPAAGEEPGPMSESRIPSSPYRGFDAVVPATQAAAPAPAEPAPAPDVGRLVDEVVRRLERIGRDERMRRGL